MGRKPRSDRKRPCFGSLGGVEVVPYKVLFRGGRNAALGSVPYSRQSFRPFTNSHGLRRTRLFYKNDFDIDTVTGSEKRRRVSQLQAAAGVTKSLGLPWVACEIRQYPKCVCLLCVFVSSILQKTPQ